MTNHEDWRVQPGYDADTSGWWLEHLPCGWQSNMQDGPRSVADLLRWIGNHECKPNQPTGFVLRRPWCSIPAGWFVKAPNGTRYEITKTRRDGDTQVVTMLVNGTEATFPRVPGQVVWCQRGTRHTVVSDAVDLFGEGAEIREDES